ncbi:hypothetical protein CTA2_853 [Colletotrichum tanaceti]|uniref:Uncharacterized protein n=1 Tax=Colletotrichum tanaceti TaxID=1306861 RepID=A0A4V6DHQ3_9PEZI|nr:hypothetical protein CTA2_853 [Colletotrichum tanaceti]TKW57376.1 hypothetical protein CTA1_7814 [Colletotrichum tanaceti]
MCPKPSGERPADSPLFYGVGLRLLHDRELSGQRAGHLCLDLWILRSMISKGGCAFSLSGLAAKRRRN